ncbi:RING-type E3 ubiquitin transferase [Sarracenia purpurea var. burkii]
MGLCNFHSPVEGVLPVLLMNTVFSLSLFINTVRSVLQSAGTGGAPPDSEADHPSEGCTPMSESGRTRRVSITRFKSLCNQRLCHFTAAGRGNNCGGNGRRSGGGGDMWWCSVECCVCLCGFEGDEEVGELPCKHFFHRSCVEKWFENHHSTCPLCRSLL